MATLCIDLSDGSKKNFRLGKRTVVIGRQEGLMVQLDDDEKLISRRHLQIRYDAAIDGYFALDLKSNNGVFINGAKVDTEARLADGDLIEIGKRSMRFLTEDKLDAVAALTDFQKVGERVKGTIMRLE